MFDSLLAQAFRKAEIQGAQGTAGIVVQCRSRIAVLGAMCCTNNPLRNPDVCFYQFMQNAKFRKVWVDVICRRVFVSPWIPRASLVEFVPAQREFSISIQNASAMSIAHHQDCSSQKISGGLFWAYAAVTAVSYGANWIPPVFREELAFWPAVFTNIFNSCFISTKQNRKTAIASYLADWNCSGD